MAGFLLPPNILAGDPGRLLVTFLGLVAASILPTISLMLTTMSASGRSVARLSALREELRSGVDALLYIFGFIAATALVLMMLSVGGGHGNYSLASWVVAAFKIQDMALILDSIPDPASIAWYAVPAAAQAAAFSFVVVVIRKAGTIPGIIRRSLELRAEMAIEEARRQTLENAPAAGKTAEAFKNTEGFGQRVALSDLPTLTGEH